MITEAHGKRLASRLLPDVLHYNPKLPAGFTFAAQNGRHPGDASARIVDTICNGSPAFTSGEEKRRTTNPLSLFFTGLKRSYMSHHFDTKLAKEDPSINVCDFYLFGGTPGTTVMAMTVNPDAGLSVPDVLHKEGLYAFRFGPERGCAGEDLAFKLQFGEARHVDQD